MAAPLYNYGDLVYFKESAALGYIQENTVSSVRSGPSGIWLYSVLAGRRNPLSAQTYGDRISLVNNAIIWHTEDEFVDKCTAYRLALENAQAQVTRLQTQLSALCGGSD